MSIFFLLLPLITVESAIIPVIEADNIIYNTHDVSNTQHDAVPSLDLFDKPALPTANLFLLIILSFAAGALSFLSPCTLPILPAYFAVTFQVDRKKIVMMSITFFIGLAAVFVIMGASASLMGSLFRKYLSSLTKIGGIIIIIFGCMTLVGRGFSGINAFNKPSSTFIGSFIFGATFAVGWTPCIGPILSGILILAAADKTVYQGMMLLFFYALGLGLPLIAISSVFGGLSRDSLFWRILKGYGWNYKIGAWNIYLHTTSILSGILLIFLGCLLASGYITALNSYIPISMQTWFNNIENNIMALFSQ